MTYIENSIYRSHSQLNKENNDEKGPLMRTYTSGKIQEIKCLTKKNKIKNEKIAPS